MDKMTLIANHNSILSREKFDEPLHISSTSGSTGIPFKVEQDSEKRNRTIADLKVFGEYALYNSHEKMLQLRSYGGKELDRTVDEKENIWRCDVFGLDSKKIQELIKLILDYKPVTIFGYVSTLETICDYIITSGIKYNFNVRSVLVGAEALTDAIADKIYSVFNCPIFDRYSNMEMGILAQREYGKTLFRINTASYYFECLKLDSDEWVKEGEIGRLVFTDLFNHAFPMIRYDTGDLGAFVRIENEIFINQVYGRKVDQLFSARGQLVDPHDISRIMAEVKGIRQWQLIQKTSREYLLNYIANGDNVDYEYIKSKLKLTLGDNAQIRFNELNEIPVMNSQKRKYILNEFRNGKLQ